MRLGLLMAAVAVFLYFDASNASAEYTGVADPFGISANESGGSAGATNPAAVALPQWTLEGLVWGGRQPQAIINGEVLNVGSPLGEARITKIEKQGVWLTYQGQEHHLEPRKKGAR